MTSAHLKYLKGVHTHACVRICAASLKVDSPYERAAHSGALGQGRISSTEDKHNQSKGQGPGYQIYLFLVCENFKSREIGMVIYVSKKKRGWGM